VEYAKGRIVIFGGASGTCNSPLLIPGIQVMPTPLLGVAYGLTLCYLFVGISIIADLFVGGIEKITS